MGSHSKSYRPVAHPGGTAKLVLILTAIAIPGFFVVAAVSGLATRLGMNHKVESAVSQALPIIWVLGSVYLIKFVLERRSARKDSGEREAL